MSEAQPARREKEIVKPEEILEQTKGDVNLRLTPTQKAGLYLAAGVGVVIAVVILLLGLDWMLRTPRPPALSTDPAAQSALSDVIENYKALNDLALERATKLFDLVIVKALLPVFTTILGYIFGSRSNGAGDGGGSSSE